MIEGPFLVAIVAIIAVFGSKIMKNWMQTQQGNAAARQKIQELERRIQALESGQNTKALAERVQVLEEIVTTDDFELQQKFRQLESKEPASQNDGVSSPSSQRPR